ncbi:MAG TPA: DGQHR domain-containing protein [Hanamia sp.]|nr:DGQHR domain-containing protein [Hanamia sp.]
MIDRINYIVLEFIKLHQPIGVFYIAKIGFKELLEISRADIRKIEHEGDFESYLGIQRDLDPKRVTELGEYVNLIDSTFPTSIILSISNKNYNDEYSSFNVPVDKIFDDPDMLDLKFEEVKNIFVAEDELDNNRKKLCIRRNDKVAKIIDGQHRIEGLKYFKGKNDQFELNVTIFEDMDIEEQAIVFATINKAQTKVNKSRVYDLYDLAKSRSPLKTAHNVAKFLNQKTGSPFLDKIKILGKADDKQETITQATFVECLLPFISRNPNLDRDLIKRGNDLTLVKGKELKRHFFRNLFIQKKDAEIAKNIYNYFNAVRDTWKLAWTGDPILEHNILDKSTGLVALFRFYKDVYLFLCKGENSTDVDENKIGTVFSLENYLAIFTPMKDKITDKVFTSDNFNPGGSGRSQLYKMLLEISGIPSL